MKLFAILFFSIFIGNAIASAEVTGTTALVDVTPQTERGIAGIKIVSDTGAYAITDEDGKYHFPFLPVGQRVLKIDASTLPKIPGVERKGFIPLEITTENPRKVIVTAGVMSKVSFGIRPQDMSSSKAFMGDPLIDSSQSNADMPLLRTSITQDGHKLSPQLAVTAAVISNEENEEQKLEFTIETNYHLFIERAELHLWTDKNLNGGTPEIIEIPMPLPLKHPIPLPEDRLRYQLTVYDTQGRMDRTSIGEWIPPDAKS